MAKQLRTCDWELEARAMAEPGLAHNAYREAVSDAATRMQVVTAIRLTATAWCLVHREPPSPHEIAKSLGDDNATAWLMENAMRTQGRDGAERQAIKELGAWYKHEWRDAPTIPRGGSAHLHYHKRGVIVQLIEGAVRHAGEPGAEPLEQLDHRSAKRRDVARELRIDDPAESTPEAEATSFGAELVKALEAEAEQAQPDDDAIKRVAWCARRALRNSKKTARR